MLLTMLFSLTLRRGLTALGAGLLFAPLFTTVSCGSKSGLRDLSSDAAVGAVDAAPDVPAADCVKDEDCVTDNLCERSACIEGKCGAPIQTVCDDADECTEDTCKPETGACDFRELSRDEDGDGFKGPRPGFAAGAPGSCGDDCDDTSNKAYPGGTEVCDGVDNNCNGVVDEGATYVPPPGATDVRISSLNADMAFAGGIAWNESFYGTTHEEDPGLGKGVKNYVKGLNPDGSEKFTEAIANLPSDTRTGPIVWTGKIFGTAWEDRRDADYEIYFNRLGADGKKLGPDIRITNAPDFSLHPSLVWNGAEFMLVWDDRRNGPDDPRIYGQRIAHDGTLLGQNVELTGINDPGESPKLAEGQKTLGIVFNTVEGTSKKIALRTYAPDFTGPGPVITLSADNAVDPSLVFNKDRYVVAFSKRNGKLPGAEIWGATVDESGQILIKEKKITTGASFARTQTLLPLGDRVLLLWADDHDGNYELYSEMLNNELEVIAPRQRITFNSANTIGPLATFGPDGDVGVLFVDDRIDQWQVYFTRLVCKAGL